MVSIKKLARDVIQKEVFDRIQSKEWRLLIADERGISLLNTLYKTSDILSQNIISIDRLENKRQPFPDKEAIYFFYPSATSMDSLIADFSRRPTYRGIHLFSIAPIPDPLFEKMTQSSVQRYVKTVIELNLDFLPVDPVFFSLETPECINSIFNASNTSLLTYQLQSMARRIASFVATLGEFPYIRYHTRPASFSTTSQESMSQKLAFLIQKELEHMNRLDPSPFNSKSKDGNSQYPKPILLIADRSLDVLAPLLHEFSYEAMIGDLLEISSIGKYWDEKNEKEILLDEQDLIWSQVRHWHIAEVMEFLPQMLKQFTADNEAAQWELQGKQSNDKIDQMKGIMGSLREYQQFKPLYALHTDICEKLMKVYNTRRINQFDEVEQNLAMADTSDSKQARLLLSDVFRVFDDSSIEHVDKLRLMLLSVVSLEGIEDSDRQRFIERGRMLPEEIQALANLGMFQVRLSPAIERNRRGTPRNPYSSNEVLKRSAGKEFKFENSKYTPVLKYVIEDQLCHHVDQFVFPWVREPSPGDIDARPASWSSNNNNPSSPNGSGDLLSPTSAGGQAPHQRKKPSWATRKNVVSTSAIMSSSSSSLQKSGSHHNVDLRQNGPRVIMFVLGGVTYSEIRSVHELRKTHQRDIILGSTHIWKPDCFVEALKRLHRPNSSGRYMEYKRPAHIPSDITSRGESLNHSSQSSRSHVSERNASRTGSAESVTSKPRPRGESRSGAGTTSSSSSSLGPHIPSRSESAVPSSSKSRHHHSSSASLSSPSRREHNGGSSSGRHGSSSSSSSHNRLNGSSRSLNSDGHSRDERHRYNSRSDSRGAPPEERSSSRHQKDTKSDPSNASANEEGSTLSSLGNAASSAANTASQAASQLASSATAFFQTSIAPSLSKLTLSGNNGEEASSSSGSGSNRKKDAKSPSNSGVSNWFGFRS